MSSLSWMGIISLSRHFVRISSSFHVEFLHYWNLEFRFKSDVALQLLEPLCSLGMR